MIDKDEPALDPGHEQQLAGDLARAVIRQVAPEELAVFDEAAADYFKHSARPQRVKGRDEVVGFGLDMALLAPSALAVATGVVRFLAAVAADAVRDELSDDLKPLISRAVRQAFRRDDPAPANGREGALQRPEPALSLTSEQGREVRQVALQTARQAGLGDGEATLLADAVVGALVVHG
jgi:hypothetical protein